MEKINIAVFDTNAQCCDIINHLIKEETMEKINVAELLSNCPKGMELDCYLFNGLEFDHIDTDNENYPIVCRAKTLDGEYYTHTFTKYGWYTSNYDYAKCVIYPKGKTTWEGFQRPYINGDILHVDCTDESDDHQHEYIFILNRIYNGQVHSYCHYYMHDGFHPRTVYLTDDKYPIRFATEEEKAKLFDAIKANGYKWNEEIKTLEKLTPDKFDITTLVSFESRVLVRGSDPLSEWKPAIFGIYRGDKHYSFYVVGGTCWKQCIPHEGNEHLLGTANDCDEYFKVWE